MVFEYKFTDDELEKITLESFRLYLENNKKTVTESRWDHTLNIIEDIDLILKHEREEYCSDNISYIKSIYDSIVEEMQQGTIFDGKSLEAWKTYCLNKHNGEEKNGKRLNSRKIDDFLKTFRLKIKSYIEKYQ
ncbi:hypothetical protein GQ472_02185 [archaeon]|nr:hypothetical protein [archaeon]